MRRLADGPIVVLARVVSVGHKAHLAVEETLRGSDVARDLVVAFRGVNLDRDTKAPPFRAREGERAVFVLARWTDASGDEYKEGVLQPVGGFQGRIPLPREGAEALLDAVRKIVSYQDTNGFGSDSLLVGQWLVGPNPWLVDVALEQAARLGMADVEMAPGLLARAADANPRRRAMVVEALGIALQRGHLERRRGAAGSAGAGDESDFPREAREVIIRLARTDPDVSVRRAAVHQLGQGAFADASRLLTAIARDDGSQEVRYEAASALADLTQRAADGS